MIELNCNSSQGMSSNLWGPPLWHYLHTISFNYPVSPTTQHKKDYYNLMVNIGKTLPCKFCRDNFMKNFEQVPLNNYSLKNRNTFSRWMYRFHSHINKMLGKPTNIKYEEVKIKFNNLRATSCRKISKKKGICKTSKYRKCEILIKE